jgi:hypothetical protein
MRTILRLCCVTFLLVGLTSCKADTPESLAKDYIKATQSSDIERMFSIMEKVSYLSEEDQQKFEDALDRAGFNDLDVDEAKMKEFKGKGFQKFEIDD